MSSLSSISIERPVLATVMSLIIVLFGAIGFSFLGVRQYPSVDPPIITVSSVYVGANAEIMESQITEPLEESINGIPGIRRILSVSKDGVSSITVEFNLDSDLEAAANDVRDRVSRVRNFLPQEMENPIVTKADASAFPIVFLDVVSFRRNMLELTQFSENVIKESLQTIPGVSQVGIWGGKKYAMRLRMNPEQLTAHNITPNDVINALNQHNVELPSGSVEGANSELTIKTKGRINDPEEYNNMIIYETDNQTVRFRDIGYAEFGPQNERGILYRDNMPLVMVNVSAQPGANNLEISSEVKRRLAIIQKTLPEDIEVNETYDSSKYIDEAIKEVGQTFYIAFILVILIIFFFLRDWRSSLIPIITIPISLMGTFFIMYLAGFSINVLTLLGIILSIGLVVDDAIVVLENIYQKIEQGIPSHQASMEGIKEIFFAVVSTTITLVAVFMPIVFLEGLTGRLFREFGVVVAAAVIISSFVALTLSPMLCARVLNKEKGHSWFYNWTEPMFLWLNRIYAQSLKVFAKVGWLSIFIILGAGAIIYYSLQNLKYELAPSEDKNYFFLIGDAQEGVTFDYMDFYTKELSSFLMEKVPERVGVFALTPGFGAASGRNTMFVFAPVVNSNERLRSTSDIVNDLNGELSAVRGIRAFAITPPTFDSNNPGPDMQYVIQANTLEELEKILPDFLARASSSPTFGFVQQDLKFNKPEINLEIDRDRAENLGVSVRDIAQTLQLGLSGQRFGYFLKDGKQYEVIGQIERDFRNDPLDIQSLNVRSNRGDLIQLDNLVSMKEEVSPPQLYRFNRFVSATLSASLVEGKTIKDGIDAMNEIADDILDDRYRTDLTGQAAEFEESSLSLLYAFLFALVLIYLVLAAQFESFRDPLIIMFTVPLAAAGALGSLWIFDQTLNIFSQIGMIMLIGLVTKNGILIVEFANQRKQIGMSVSEAVMSAANSRFRPILMTSLSTILGTLPIALAIGAGSESRISMGIAVIGGLVFSTILTLYIIPVIYMTISDKSTAKAITN